MFFRNSQRNTFWFHYINADAKVDSLFHRKSDENIYFQSLHISTSSAYEMLTSIQCFYNKSLELWKNWKAKLVNINRGNANAYITGNYTIWSKACKA